MTIRFINLSGEEISENQATGWYRKEYTLKNEMKRIDDCSDDKIQSIIYYKEDSETDAQVIATLSDITTLEWITIIEKRTFDIYRIQLEATYYKEENNLFKMDSLLQKAIFNKLNDWICSENIFTVSEPIDVEYNVISKKFTFHYDGITIPANFPYLECCFDKERKFHYSDYHPDPETDDSWDIEEYNLEQTLNFLHQLGFSDNWKEWYVNDNFLPPDFPPELISKELEWAKEVVSARTAQTE